MLIGFIGLYIAGTLLIGWWASRRVKSTADFVIAGRRLPLVVAASALFATWFGSETIMGASSEFVEHGLIGVIEDPFGAALCLFLVGMFFARPLYKLNLLTFNDFFRLRFGKQAEQISVFFMIPSYFGWIAAQLVALAIVLKSLMGLPIFAGIILCTLIVLIYTYIGGMWAVSITDFVQTIMILIGLVIICAQMLQQAGGLQTVIERQPPGFFRFLPEANFHDIVHYFAAWITIGLGSIPQQDVFQRVMSARNVRTAVRASYLSSFMYLTIGFIPLLIGLCANVLYAEEPFYQQILQEDTQMVIPQVVLAHGSLGVQVLFFGALLSAVLSTTSGAMLAPATVLGENFIKPRLKKVTDSILLRIMRLSVVLVAVASAVMANLKQNIYELVGDSSALSLVALFIPLTAGLYWKRASNAGTLWSMFAGTAVWLFCEFYGTEIPSLIYGGLASVAGMILGSWWRPDESYRAFLERDRTL